MTQKYKCPVLFKIAIQEIGRNEAHADLCFWLEGEGIHCLDPVQENTFFEGFVYNISILEVHAERKKFCGENDCINQLLELNCDWGEIDLDPFNHLLYFE